LRNTKSPLYKQPPTVGKKIGIGEVNAFASNACIEVYIISLEEWNGAYIRVVKDEDYNEVGRENVEWKALSGRR
jgi:hypothetical protein